MLEHLKNWCKEILNTKYCKVSTFHKYEVVSGNYHTNIFPKIAFCLIYYTTN